MSQSANFSWPICRGQQSIVVSCTLCFARETSLEYVGFFFYKNTVLQPVLDFMNNNAFWTEMKFSTKSKSNSKCFVFRVFFFSFFLAVIGWEHSSKTSAKFIRIAFMHWIRVQLSTQWYGNPTAFVYSHFYTSDRVCLCTQWSI